MRYLLINHVPFGRSPTPGRFIVGDMWLEDLRAQARAINDAGMALTVATPLVDKLDLASCGSFNAVDINPDEHGFSYAPLPFYVSFKQYLTTKRKMVAAMTEAIGGADIVQAGYGGHPVALGSIAWPIAGALHRKRIWIFDGGDPFPQWRYHAATIQNPIKRQLRMMQLRRLENFIARAISEADIVFAHNNSVVERFANVWHAGCHQFHRSFVTKKLLISKEELAGRQKTLLDRSQPLRLTATGRQIAIKGTDQLLRAFRQAIDRGANLGLNVIGDGDALAKYQALAAELQLSDRVHFPGAVPYGQPLFDAWSREHALVVTNLTSEFSRNLLLSMARGLPLITYSNQGDSVVEPSGAAIVVPMGDVPALADALVEADRDRERLATLATRGLDLVHDMTLEECHRRRAEIAVGCLAAKRQPSAASGGAKATRSPCYLLVSHVPFAAGSLPGTFKLGDLWLEDLRAQAKAVAREGMRLVVASPLAPQFEGKHSGSFNAVEINPADEGFSYVPLPFYLTFKQYLKTKTRMIAAMAEAIRGADIVQAGYGGHPVALGEVTWPIAAKLRRKRIWVFDGADPFPRLELHASRENNPIKRALKKIAVHRFERFCGNAVRSADLVFAHNAAVVERFKSDWNGHCHQFDRSFVTDQTLLTDDELCGRQKYLGGAAQPLRLVVAGRQIAIKATDHVLRAMKQARDGGANLTLNVMGDGDELASFKSLAAELNLSDVVHFAGTVPYGKPLFDAWSAAHVMVITNLTAEISRNVMLAMARGLPLIMYTNPGTDELLRQSGAGTLVPKGDIGALARAFEQAAANRPSLIEMAARGLGAAKLNTLDATHRKRAQLAASQLTKRSASTPEGDN